MNSLPLRSPQLRATLECGGKRSATPLLDGVSIGLAAFTPKAVSPLRSITALQGWLTLLIAFLCLFAANAQAQITFAAPNIFSVGDAPKAAVMGDFNGDGKLDAAVINSGSNTISILLGDGAGGFATPITIAVDANPVAIAAGDFNGDGKLDLVTAHPDSGPGSGSIVLRLGDGAGGFTFSVKESPSFGRPRALAVGDFNNDGKLDVIAANGETNSVTAYYGNGAGGFTGSSTQGISAAPFAITLGDFNSDGRLDYATANPATDNVSVALGLAGGGFSAPTTFAVSTQPKAIAAGDFNRDGKLDLVTANAGNNDGVSFLAGNGAGSFAAATGAAGFSNGTLALGDFDDDSQADLVTGAPVAGIGDNIFRGDGSGGFAGGTYAQTNLFVINVATGDFNRDGKPDVLSVGTRQVNGQTIGSIAVNLNTTITATCSTTNFSHTAVPSSVNPFGMTTADFNHDGKLDYAVAGDTDTNNLTVRFGNGNGTFAAATRYTTSNSQDVVAGDFNGDGYADLAVANYQANNVSLLLNDRAGGFPAIVNLAVGDTTPVKLIAADFNKDGKLDLATLNGNSQGSPKTISILLGDGHGGFSPPRVFRTGGMDGLGSFVAADFNGDGNIDFACIYSEHQLPEPVWILYGDGQGWFASPVAALDLGHFSFGLVAGDFNRDGKVDLVVLFGFGYDILTNRGGGFTQEIVNIDDYFLSSIRTGDFDNDGKLDLTIGTYTDDHTASSNPAFLVLRGDGTGHWGAPLEFKAPGFGVTALTTGDFDRDGKLDLLSSLYTSNGNLLSLNTCVDNVAPVAMNDNFGGRQAATLDVPAPGVLANDTDNENNALTAVLVTPPAQGSLTLRPDGSFSYTPPAGFQGATSFTYKASDGRLQSNTATVTLTINNPPTANNDSATLPEDAGAVPIDVLRNDTADPGEPIVGIVSVTQGANGAVAIINNDQFVTYTPNPNFAGTDSFTYSIIDNRGGLASTATVFVNVLEINDPPTAKDDYVELVPNSPATTIDVLANDTFAPDAGESLRITSATQGTRGGTVVITNNGADLTYQPPTNFQGGDSFTYTISDGRGGNATATVYVDIPNTLIVTNNSDIDDGVCDANCSLREAINAANADVSRTIIDFAPQVRGTIQLTSPAANYNNTQLLLSSRVTLRGPGAAFLNVRGRNVRSPLESVITITQGSTTISGLTISNGSGVDNLAGGIATIQADAVIEDCIVAGNQGAGVVVRGGKVRINNSTIANNLGNGGIGVSSGELLLTNSTVSGNTNPYGDFNDPSGFNFGAGGIAAGNSILTISNSTISGNSSSLDDASIDNAAGGVVAVGNGQTTITNSTIVNNQGSFVGGLYTPLAKVGSSIIAGNSATDGGNRNNIAVETRSRNLQLAMVSRGYNLVGTVGDETYFNQPTDQIGYDFRILNPQLAPLAYNGGVTQTHALLSNSPAIDKGEAFGSLLDQRGSMRPSDLPGVANASGGDGSDIGAVEMTIGISVELTSGPGSERQARVIFVGIPGRTYRVQSSEDLINWTTRTTLPANQVGTIEFIDPAPLPTKRFYRTLTP